MALSDSLYSIILAAGKGRRMRSQTTHKVCFPIAGTPAILRALDVYNRVGIARNVVVVGDLAGQVVELVGQSIKNVVFTYQPKALGTGDATQIGFSALDDIDPNARLLLVAGDKLVDAAVLTRLINACVQSDADLGLIVSPAAWGGESAGRVLSDALERPLAIVEASDIRQRETRNQLVDWLKSTHQDPTIDELNQQIEATWGSGKTLTHLIGQLDSLIDADTSRISRVLLLAALAKIPAEFVVGPHQQVFSPALAWKAPFRNEFVYLVKKRALEFGLKHMDSANAQGETYLTDAIGAICSDVRSEQPAYRVCQVVTESPHDVMSYNNPEELLRIEDHLHGEHHQTLLDLQSRLGTSRLKTVSEWKELFPTDGTFPTRTQNALRQYYGDDPETLQDRFIACRKVIECFEANYGLAHSVMFVRSPGRINVMGRHVDWQGGRCNLMAVTQEVLMAVSPRQDDIVLARNVDSIQFPDVDISLSKLVSTLDWDNWMSVVNSNELTRHLRDSAGHWRLYVEAALLRLQMAHRDTLLTGMNMAVCGNIPVAAGLSSSSAIVVATAEAAIEIHDLKVEPQEFVNFCGEGEWFVGTRGGSADHAAMKFGEMGTINHVTFHDFGLIEKLRFPETHRLVVANSGVQAKKAAGAKEAFNARVGSYVVGVELVKRNFPQYAPFVKYIRDINPETLQVTPSRIYEILLSLPLSMTAAEVRKAFEYSPDAWKTLEKHFANARLDAEYPVRGVVMFGITECARSRRAADLLRSGSLSKLGELMRISHDGERCYRTNPDGSAIEYSVDVSDSALRQLISNLASQDPDLVSDAQLHRQPGAYRCSTIEIDTLVDIACRIEGVEGAQIAGAGLGGCAMILVRADRVDDLNIALKNGYYEPQNRPATIFKCSASAGSGLMAFET